MKICPNPGRMIDEILEEKEEMLRALIKKYTRRDAE